jgi:hypothetical protein
MNKLLKVIILLIVVAIWVNLPRFENNVRDSKNLTDEENELSEQTADWLNITFLRTPVGLLVSLIGTIIILATHKEEQTVLTIVPNQSDGKISGTTTLSDVNPNPGTSIIKI